MLETLHVGAISLGDLSGVKEGGEPLQTLADIDSVNKDAPSRPIGGNALMSNQNPRPISLVPRPLSTPPVNIQFDP